VNRKKIDGWIVRDGFAAVGIGSAGVGVECGEYPRNGIICSI